MSEWLKLKLRDIIVLNYGKALKTQDRKDGNIPVFSSAGLTGYHNQALIEKEGIIVGRKGTIGKIYISNSPFWCIDTAYYILPNPEKYDFLFIFYLLQTLGLEELNEDSAVPGLNRNTVYNQCFTLPPLPEQKAIASILSSIDDKIDLLHCQNKTLESMAETLFRQCFNNYLQTNKKCGCVGDLFSPLKGKNITRKNVVKDGSYPVVAGGLEPSCFHNKYNTQKPVITISASGANAGFVRLYHTNVWSSDSSYIDKSIFPYIYYAYILLKLNQNTLFDSQVGSAQPHIYPKNIMELELSIPPIAYIKDYDDQVAPFFKKIEFNDNQIKSLSDLRDILLPKLMSGEVRVKLD